MAEALRLELLGEHEVTEVLYLYMPTYLQVLELLKQNDEMDEMDEMEYLF